MSLTPTTSWCRSNDIVSSSLPCFSFFLFYYIFTHFRFFTKQSTKSIKNTRQRTLGDRPTDPPIMLTYFKNSLCKRVQRTCRVFCQCLRAKLIDMMSKYRRRAMERVRKIHKKMGIETICLVY